MQEATGQAGLMNIMLTIIGIIIILLAGSIAYSKAFRVKNRIVDIIEKYNVYDNNSATEIENALTDIGYRTMKKTEYLSRCNSKKFSGFTLDTTSYPSHMYCIYKAKSKDSYYYKVVTYMYFDLPVVGNFIQIPVTGETKMLYSKSTAEWKTVK